MSQQKKEQYVLFYSKKCSYSKKMLGILNEYPDLNVLFNKLAIEDLKKLPAQLREVPAIAISNTELLQSQQAFSWLEKKVADFFSAGDLGRRGLLYTSINGEELGEDSSLFSSISRPRQDQIQVQQEKPKSRSDIKQDDFNKDFARLQEERSADMPKSRPPPTTPDFSLPIKF